MKDLKIFASRFSPVYMFAIILLVLSCGFFRWSHYMAQEKIRSAAQSILRNESTAGNSYALSKSILDLEQMDVIRCSEVIFGVVEKKVFYSTLRQNQCYGFWPLRIASELSFEAKSVSGQTYGITLQMPIPWHSWILETMIYLAIAIGAANLKRHLAKQEEIALMRAKALEIEKQDKQKLVDMTKQIRHDVQAPLSATKQILKMVKDIDPALREILERSMDRTQELFNQLNASTNSAKVTKCSVNKITGGIAGEKTMSWSGTGVELIYNSTLVDGQDTVMANEMDFGRLVSNILNNGAEACADRPIKRIELTVGLAAGGGKVEILIADSGKGMPQSVIDKLGQKGFTQGKEGHATAGSGLGVYHAISTVRGWDGEFVISSKENVGTTMRIVLPKA